LPSAGLGFAGQNEKGGLARILGILNGGQHAPANTQNQSRMPFDNGRERGLVAGAELGEQFPIR
jgi:hypothetical protein